MTEAYDSGMYVSFPVGTTYILVLDTDAYSGNFERQLCGYVTGICDEERYHGDKEAEAASEADPEMVGRIQSKAIRVVHNQYGRVSNTIRRTPFGKDHNGYCSVAIFFEHPLDAKEMKFVRKRAKEYAAKPISEYVGAFKLVDVYMVKVMTFDVVETIVAGL